MAVIIGTETFQDEGQKNYMLMGNLDQYIRRFNVRPNSWSLARVGILWAMEGYAARPYITGGLLVGLTTSANGEGVGYKQGLGANIVRGCFGAHNMWGITWGYSGTNFTNYNYAADPVGGGAYYTNLLVARGYNNGVQTGGAGNTAGVYVPTTESINRGPRKGVMILNLQKSATNILCSCGGVGAYTSSNGTNHNYTDNALISAIQLNSPAVDGNGLYFNSNGTMANNDEALYPMDTINVLWTGSVPIRLYQVAFAMVR